ncbi:mycofactocin-coupled SDR family oxidoreductase [Nocardia sp. SYP-A9097]|uniref:mycofactocin-coupled SDR family oxidoreductase n=1 Tax=Nocardia sp. SYP-A9097 TaxID=2663237 RepID=UPI00129C0012|nr:mycofactocin-coupled SDR family oxidoreductase [Nocardia sp. SYP-A9097]MRH86748.1 mycofactocin-coupled SDR family oxidoreductase [Nocardia sp. SYP-A9097]
MTETTPADKPLTGKVAYVTGAARGQGRSHVLALARAGADIVAIDACTNTEFSGYPMAEPEDLAETARLVKAVGGNILTKQVDVRDLEGQQSVVAEAIAQFGRLDIVVANAGVCNWGRLWEISAEQFAETVDVNLTGVWNTIKAAVPAMIEAGNGGSIMTISSSAGVKAPPGCGHYAATKYGVVGLTKSLAIELGEYGIRVNTLLPYGTNTPLGNDTSMYKMFEEYPAYVYSYTPTLLKTEGLVEPEEISEVVVWLAGAGSGVITGAQIPVDKGFLAR